MKAGEELDTLIFTRVMGLTMSHVSSIPHYSTDISAAWEVVEKLRGVWDIRSMSKTWVAILSVQVGTSDKRVGEEAETAPLAICLAALKAVEI